MTLLKYSNQLLTVYLVVCVNLCRSEASYPEDTYINALQTSQTITDSESNVDFEGYHYSPPPNNQYLPPTTQPAIYGPPAPIYGPPAPVYGNPHPIYYKPIPFHAGGHLSLLEKLKTKINLFTIGKIILKLLIFKKIVKFIGIICMLLFLPKLKGMFKEGIPMDDDSTESKQVESEQDALKKRIDEIFEFTTTALNKFDGVL
ncbi:uncharacterized protein LOC131995206 [Stomoxys calcitrans]|uniref:uncharacterized protein LOC131995206 n=1 Tax=Stomoxys calcitrans TaxID=35570 RepID=UPI0027E3443F|nr:uncharacterized protein LOC131995206 [Stomoxys calcitrans]